jgi:hypothetical protein
MTAAEPKSRALIPAATTSADRQRGDFVPYRDRPLLVVVGVQFVWFWWAYSRGWYLQSDLSNLADAAEHRLGWHYIALPAGGHFGPVMRFVYWLILQVGQLDYTYTVALRVGLQAVSTVLLYLVMVELVGRQPLVIAVLAAYAVNPIMLGGGAWLTSGLALTFAQALALGAILAYLRYVRSGRLRIAALSGLLLVLTVLTSDQWVIAALVPPLLALTHLYRGGFGARIRQGLSHWRAWLLILGPFAAAVVAILLLGNPSGSSSLTADHALRLLRESWLKSVAPSWFGGPWHWINGTGIYISFAAPPDWMVLLGQLGAAVLVVIGLQRLGARSLLAWIMPVVCAVVAVLIVGFGRYGTYGQLLAITPRYLFPTVALFAIGVVLALAPVAGQPAPQHTQRPRFDRLQAVIATSAAALIVTGCLISGARFATALGNSPVHDYVANLETGVRAHGSNVNIWDTPVPQSVISSVEPNHRVSDVLHLADVPAQYDSPTSEPLLVTTDGHLTTATFVSAAQAVQPGDSCGTFVHGVGTWNIPLDHTPHPAEWFLRILLYQGQPSDVTIHVVDDNGKVSAPIRGAAVRLGTLEARNLALPLVAPAQVRVHSAAASTNLCLSHIYVGGPFPSGS